MALRALIHDESGGMTAFGLFTFTSAMMIGGLAIDVQHAIAARTQLQAATDSAVHAALLTRDVTAAAPDAAATAKARAIEVLQGMLPAAQFGNVVTVDSITFGTWDRTTATFTPDASSSSAVELVASRNETAMNPVKTYLLGLVGVDYWNLQATAVAETYHPTCFREGFVAEDVVDIQSNNTFTNGFCIHSNEHVSLNNNNTFEAGTIVSMPDLTALDLPASGFDKNAGLKDALRTGSYHIRVLKQIDAIIAGLRAFDPRYLPPYIAPDLIETLTSDKLTPADFKPNRLHVYTCAPNKGLKISDGTLSKIALVTNCEITFVNIALEDAVIATTHTGASSMHHNSAMRIGRNDGCAEGGGAQLLSMGGMDFAGNLEIYGSQLLAAGDIQFAANADGIEGASLVAGGRIDGTSNMAMGFCGTGMDANFQANYFRLVQ